MTLYDFVTDFMANSLTEICIFRVVGKLFGVTDPKALRGIDDRMISIA